MTLLTSRSVSRLSRGSGSSSRLLRCRPITSQSVAVTSATSDAERFFLVTVQQFVQQVRGMERFFVDVWSTGYFFRLEYLNDVHARI